MVSDQRGDGPERRRQHFGRDSLGFPVTRRANEFRRTISTEEDETIADWIRGFHCEFASAPMASPEEKLAIHRLLYTWRDRFINDVRQIPATNLIKLSIPTLPRAKAEASSMPLYTLEDKIWQQENIPALVEAGVLCPGRSEWNSKTKFVRKKNGKLHMVNVFCGPNAVTIKDNYPMKRLEEILDAVGRDDVQVLLFKCNAAIGYWAVCIDIDDAYKTAFPTRYGQLPECTTFGWGKD